MSDSQNAAQEALSHLPPQTDQLSLRCPLCNTTAPARGIMPRNDPVQNQPRREQWELAFICPACGLYTTFAIERLKPEQIIHLSGSSWAAKLREPELETQTTEMMLPRTDDDRMYMATTFTACIVLYLMLTGSFAPADVLWGLVVSTGVTALTYRFVAFGAPRWMLNPRKWLAFLLVGFEFSKQLVVQNFTLLGRVMRPNMPIKPGIVAVPYNIRRDVPLTIMSSLLSLTPDTVLVDIDEEKGIMYFHWINVKTTDPQEAYRLLVQDMEEKMIAWLD